MVPPWFKSGEIIITKTIFVKIKYFYKYFFKKNLGAPVALLNNYFPHAFID